MARIRTIKPEFFSSETVSGLPFRARLTFVGLWTCCDDAGRFRADPRVIKGSIWPLDDDVSPADVTADLTALGAAGLIRFYTVDGKRYLFVTNWAEHQYIQRKSVPKYPEPPENTQVSDFLAEPHGRLTESDMSPHGAVVETAHQELEVELEVELGSGSGSGTREDRAMLVVPGVQAGATLTAPAPRTIDRLVNEHAALHSESSRNLVIRWYDSGKSLDELWGALDRITAAGWPCTEAVLRRELIGDPRPTIRGPATQKAIGWEAAANEVKAARARGALL